MALVTQIFDDGSTLTYDEQTGAVSATESPYYNIPSATYSPSGINPNASSWDDVLKFGLSRLIDAKVRPVRPENTAPILATPAYTFNGAGGGLSAWLPWLLIGGVGLYALSKLAK